MKQKTLRYLFLLLLVFALPILMLPNNAGAWSYTADGAVAAGIVSGGALTTQGLSYSGKTANHSAIFGGWSISSVMANYVTNYFALGKTPTANITYNCLTCHVTDSYGGGHDKTSYLLTGHKNMARKVAGASYSWQYGTDNCSATGCATTSPTYSTTGKYWWAGPSGNLYLTDSATNGDTINWVTGQLTTSGGATSNIYYTTMHGWMEWFPFVDLAMQSTSTGKASNAELCGECHQTGATDSANVLGGDAVANYNFLTAAQPDASTSAALSWGAGNTWVLDGVECTQCHDATPTAANWQWSGTPGSKTDSHGHPIAMGYSIYEGSTELCFSCHQGGEVSPYVDGTTGATSSNWKPALSMKVTTNAPNFNMSHGTPSVQFFNSPHGRFTGTAGSNAQGSRGTWGTYVYTTPSGVKTTIPTQTANLGSDQVWQPTAYASLFKNSVSGDANEGRNYGCAEACHDPHISTVDAINAQPMQISCNGYTNTATGAAAAGGLGANTGATAQGTIQPVTVYNCHQSTNTKANNPTGSVTSAGDPLAIDLTQINHPVGVGTPLGTTSGDPSQASDACVTCHMPRPDNGNYAGNGGNSEVMKLHFFRINTDVNYSTFPAYTSNTSGSIGYNNNGVLQQANTAYDGSSFPGADAVWVDLDLACGQCHGGGATQNFTSGNTTAASAVLTIPATAAANAAMANMKAGDRIRIVGAGIANGLLIAGETGSADQHSIIKMITLPNNLTAGTITLTEVSSTSVTGAEVITNPTANGANYFPKTYLADMAANMHNQSAQVSVATTPASTVGTVGFTATLVDNSTSGTNITVNWGDGNLSGNAAVSTGVAGGTFTHTYPSPGRYTVTHTASTGPASSIENITISVPTNFTVGGTVTNNAAAPLVGATVILKQNGITKKIATSGALGAYSFSNVPFGTYTISAYDASYTFTPASITVNATIAGHTIAAN
jgi:hypothetical protein